MVGREYNNFPLDVYQSVLSGPHCYPSEVTLSDNPPPTTSTTPSPDLLSSPSVTSSIPSSPQRGARARFTVVETVYFQPASAEPTQTGSRFCRWVGTDEQPYKRQTKVGESWVPLDAGWLKEAGMLVLANKEGEFFRVNPTEEERTETAKKIVEVGLYTGVSKETGQSVIEPFARVHPAESTRFTPLDLSVIRLRCLSGDAKILLTLLPG